MIRVGLVIKGCNPKLYKWSMKLLVLVFLVSCCRRSILKSPHRYTVLLRECFENVTYELIYTVVAPGQFLVHDKCNILKIFCHF